MKISTSSSIIFATLAMSSSSPCLAAPTGEEGGMISSSSNQNFASRRVSVSMPRADMDGQEVRVNMPGDYGGGSDETHTNDRRGLLSCKKGELVSPLVKSLLGPLPVGLGAALLGPLGPVLKGLDGVLCGPPPGASSAESVPNLTAEDFETAAAQVADIISNHAKAMSSDADPSAAAPSAPPNTPAVPSVPVDAPSPPVDAPAHAPVAAPLTPPQAISEKKPEANPVSAQSAYTRRGVGAPPHSDYERSGARPWASRRALPVQAAPPSIPVNAPSTPMPVEMPATPVKPPVAVQAPVDGQAPVDVPIQHSSTIPEVPGPAAGVPGTVEAKVPVARDEGQGDDQDECYDDDYECDDDYYN